MLANEAGGRRGVSSEIRRRRPSGLRAVGGPYRTVLGPAAPAAPLTGGRIADTWPPQCPGQLSLRLHRRGHRTASLRQPSPLRASRQVVRSCHPRASRDGRQRYAAAIHGHRERPLSCGFVRWPWTTPQLIWLCKQVIVTQRAYQPCLARPTDPVLLTAVVERIAPEHRRRPRPHGFQNPVGLR